MDTLLGYVVIFLVGCLVGLYVLIVLVGKLIVDSGCFSDRSSKADAEAAEQRERKRERPPEILRQTLWCSRWCCSPADESRASCWQTTRGEKRKQFALEGTNANGVARLQNMGG